jgi:3-oxoadipate enol-lactonase
MITTRFVDVPARPDARPARIAVHLAGRGPLAMLVHGFPLDHRMWLEQLHGPLAEHRTLCAIDLRGHGQSPYAGDERHDMATFAGDVALVIKALTDGPVDVCGLSMGGYVAFALQASAPQLVRSLVLSNTRAAADTDAQRKAREQGISAAVNGGARAVAAAMLPELLAARCDPLLVARARTMIEHLSVEAIVADQRGLALRPDRTDLLPTITVPTLVVAGETDPIVPLAESQTMHRNIPGSRLAVIDGSAHLSPLERPADWAAAVRSLWSADAPPPA